MQDPDESFQELCLVFGDFNRPVFLEAILRWFVDSADPKELAALRHGIQARAKLLRSLGKRGRPRAEESRQWLHATLRIVWQREIEHWTWPKIAAAAGMKPTKANIRTLENRRNHYAMLVWKAVASTESCGDPREALNKMLSSKSLQRWFRSQVALPFDTDPEQCKRIVLALAPRGLRVAASDFLRTHNRLAAARKTRPSSRRP